MLEFSVIYIQLFIIAKNIILASQKTDVVPENQWIYHAPVVSYPLPKTKPTAKDYFVSRRRRYYQFSPLITTASSDPELKNEH